MANYLVYWKIENVREAQNTPNWSHACWGSGRKDFGTRFSNGDRIFFTTIDEQGDHIIFSEMVLDRYSGSKEDTEKRVPFSLSGVPFDSFWMGREPWGRHFEVPFRNLAMTLEFKSGKRLPQGYDGQNLQSIRELTPLDTSSIEKLLDTFLA
jgi:hypothetical protein